MTRSLRSRLVVGMLLGMAVLLIAADVTVYTVQRRQLYRAFDETLLGSANSLTLLFHPGPFGIVFDSEGLARLPAGRIRQGALYQFWSDQPIHLPPRPPDANFAGKEATASRPSPGDGPPPRPPFAGQEWPHGPNQLAGPLAVGGFPGPHERPGPPAESPPGEPSERRPGHAPPEMGAGVYLIRSPMLNGADLPRLAASLDQPRFENISLPGGSPGRAVGLRFRLTPPGPAPRWMPQVELSTVVAAGTADLEKQLRFLAALLVATGLGTMAVSGGVAWLVVSRGLRPLASVARKIGVMDETDLKQRIADDGVPREIEPLVHQLNGLLGRLDEAFDRERALTADVAHELRTPAAEIRAIAEVTLSRLRDPEEYRQALGEALDVTMTLQGLIEKLLILARLEAGQMKPDLEPVALKPALARHWAELRNRAESRGVTFEDHCGPEAIVSADPKLLEVVLANVLSNAAAYAPDGGRITVETQRVGSRCRLSVTNPGCNLSENEVAKVFDRFWRADTARSKTGLNCGLGLTLVRRAMEAIGGAAEAAVSSDRRFILTLAFAAAEQCG